MVVENLYVPGNLEFVSLKYMGQFNENFFFQSLKALAINPHQKGPLYHLKL